MNEESTRKLSHSPDPSASEGDVAELRFGEGGRLLLTKDGLSINGKSLPLLWLDEDAAARLT
jgi:hypothetical protein